MQFRHTGVAAVVVSFVSLFAAVAATGAVVVDEVPKHAIAEGLQSGDVIEGWKRPEANAFQPVTSPFHFLAIEMNEVPTGPIVLSIQRGNEQKELAISNRFRLQFQPTGAWRLNVAPQFSGDVLAAHQRAKTHTAATKFADAAKEWRAAAALKTDATSRVWLLLRAASDFGEAKQFGDAHAAIAEAALLIDEKKEPALRAFAHDVAAMTWMRESKLKESGAEREKAAALHRTAGLVLSAANDINIRGVIARMAGNLDEADAKFREAMAITRHVAPKSVAHGNTVTNIGINESFRGNVDAAEAHMREALEIRRAIDPDGMEEASAIGNLGSVLNIRGRLSEAEQLFRRDIAIRERLTPGQRSVSISYLRLGTILFQRGDLAGADEVFRKALAIDEQRGPTLELASTYQQLTAVEERRGDLDAAAATARKSVEIIEKVAPESVQYAGALSNIGLIAIKRGKLEEAEQALTKALAVMEKAGPGHLTTSDAHLNLGELALARRDFAKAEQHYQRALEVRKNLAPESMQTAGAYDALASVAYEKGDYDATAKYIEQALHIAQKLAPGSTQHARALYGMGIVARKRRELTKAADYLQRAVEALETQSGRLGGTADTKAAFRAGYAPLYRELMEVLLELKKNGEALHILERSRAQSLLTMLAERDLVFSADVPPELEEERRRINFEYDRVHRDLNTLNPAKDATKIEELQQKARELTAGREKLRERVAALSPRLASLQYPRPLDLAGVQRALDRGTVLLAYSAGEKETILFVATNDGPLAVHRIAAGGEALRERVDAVRSLIGRAAEGSDAVPPALIAKSKELYDLLVAPAAAQIGKSKRVLVMADGALHALPFGALVREVKRSKPQYLVEWKPVHKVVSATVYAELQKTRRSRDDAQSIVAAFGDPYYPAREVLQQSATPAVRSLVQRFGLQPLPASREEVDRIATLFGDDATRFVGTAASEENAKALGRRARYVHFACHGIIDEQTPLNSGLALSIDAEGKARENGLLQAWEIFEHLRLDADLVTLSACETGLGRELAGEGLVGLTRAFQYAGARSVVASLWGVSDVSTSELMKRFYENLKSGQPKDEAMRNAQLALLRGGSAHPFHWASFEVIGDWQ